MSHFSETNRATSRIPEGGVRANYLPTGKFESADAHSCFLGHDFPYEQSFFFWSYWPPLKSASGEGVPKSLSLVPMPPKYSLHSLTVMYSNFILWGIGGWVGGVSSIQDQLIFGFLKFHFSEDLVQTSDKRQENTIFFSFVFFLFCFVHRTSTESYSFSSDRSLALGLVTLMASCWARSTMSLRFLLETLCAISAANVRFCIIRTSRSCIWNQGKTHYWISTHGGFTVTAVEAESVPVDGTTYEGSTLTLVFRPKASENL